jgi:hypothetical protein
MFSAMEDPAHNEGLLAAYRAAGFRTRARIDRYEGKHQAFVITLDRRQKNGVQRLRHGASQFL